MKTRLRNYGAYVWYGVGVRRIRPWILGVNVLILGYSLWQLPEFLSEKNVVILLLLIFMNVVWQFVGTVGEIYAYMRKTTYYREDNCKIVNRFRLGDEVERLYRFPDGPYARTDAIYRPDVDALLISGRPVVARLSRRKEDNIRYYIRQYGDMLIPFLNCQWHEALSRDRAFFNEKKLCMASEVYADGDCLRVWVNRGNYYNSYVTNNIYNVKLSSQDGLELMAPVNALNNPVQTLDESALSNHIGISTMAITVDGCLVVMHHNNRALITPNMITPSSSGSMDFSDLCGDDFVVSLTRAVEREFREETNLGQEIIGGTKVIGFYRDLKRGGKPEFCCVTRLKARSQDVRHSLDPSRLEQRTDFKLVPLTRDGAFSAEALQAFVSEHRHECAQSFVMNAFFLGRFYAAVGMNPGSSA